MSASIVNLEKDRLFTCEEARHLIYNTRTNTYGVAYPTVRRYLQDGRLGKMIPGGYIITGDDIEKFNATPRQVGNPNFGSNSAQSQ